MIQYVRGRIGEDRDTILDMGRIPDYAARFPLPSTPLQAEDTSERWQVPYGSTTAGGGFKPIVPIVSEGDDPGKQASKRSPEYSPFTDDDERPELKRSKQCKGVTTVIISTADQSPRHQVCQRPWHRTRRWQTRAASVTCGSPTCAAKL